MDSSILAGLALPVERRTYLGNTFGGAPAPILVAGKVSAESIVEGLQFMNNIKRLLVLLVAPLALALASQGASAAFITIDESGMDAVFSQSGFGAPVDIRIGPTTELVLPGLLDITTGGQIGDLFSNHVGAANVVNFYFVDTIDACGATILSGIVGCGETPGNDFVVESVFASGANGVELLSHELGHNLSLAHRNGASTLMNPTINGGTDLNAAEILTISLSSLVQTDINGLFIQINPVLVSSAAAVVPLPSAVWLLLSSIGLLSGAKRLRSAATTG